MADSTQIAENLDKTIAALQQGLTAIPPEQAVVVIDTWQQQLQGTDLAEDLGQLKAALTSGDVTGESLKAVLTDLGEDTGEVAADAGGEVATKLQQLSKLLTQAGGSL
ncbi:hypothetical protein [Gloeobacter violaceus]|uniref:hypothetical protein n=1 Tax=Gloeobacter violaceus TaxID=33072 RepID=UPI00030E2DB0|nr:hypothetical protein [Gloeobacter violaceus]